jgi:hypothetical protein
MKLITITFLTVAAAFAQTAESRTPVTDAEKIAVALGAGPGLSPKARRCSTGRRRLEANIEFFVKVRTNGPAFRQSPGIHTMSPVASTRYSCAGFRTSRRPKAAH